MKESSIHIDSSGATKSEPVLQRQTSLSLSQRLKVPITKLSQLDLGPRGRKDYQQLTEDPRVANDKLSQEIQELAHRLEQECMNIIFVIMPQKVVHLDAMYKNDPRFSKTSQEIEREGPLPSQDVSEADRRKTFVPCNKAIADVADALKNELILLGEYMNSLSIWIQSFNQEVQLELLEQIKGAEAVSIEVQDQFATYFLTRAELICKVLKWPQVVDYRKAIIEADEKAYMKMAMVAADLRSLYLTMFDLFSKNLASLLEQPTNQSEKMFY